MIKCAIWEALGDIGSTGDGNDDDIDNNIPADLNVHLY